MCETLVPPRVTDMPPPSKHWRYWKVVDIQPIGPVSGHKRSHPMLPNRAQKTSKSLLELWSCQHYRPSLIWRNSSSSNQRQIFCRWCPTQSIKGQTPVSQTFPFCQSKNEKDTNSWILNRFLTKFAAWLQQKSQLVFTSKWHQTQLQWSL